MENFRRRTRKLLDSRLEIERGPDGWRLSAVGLPAMVAAVLMCLALLLLIPGS
jgi:hypothetical protein